MATKAQLERCIVDLESALNVALAANEKFLAGLAAAQAAIVERDERIAGLEERLGKLESRLMTSSENSSLPPSKNPPHVKRGRKSGPSGNSPGGRPGHTPFTFSPVPDEAVGRTVECPSAPRCGCQRRGRRAHQQRGGARAATGRDLAGLMNSTKSAKGRLAFTRLMCASATCRKQGRNFLGYLKHALDAHARGLSPPPLLPA